MVRRPVIAFVSDAILPHHHGGNELRIRQMTQRIAVFRRGSRLHDEVVRGPASAKRFQVAVVTEDGQVLLNKNAVNGPESMPRFIGDLPSGHLWRSRPHATGGRLVELPEITMPRPDATGRVTVSALEG